MDFLFDNNTSIVEGSLGIDPVTGLEIKVQYTNINIDSRTKTITIYWDEVLVSPQNQVVSIRTNGCFSRNNELNSLKYSEMFFCPAGVIIRQMLLVQDFPYHPDYVQGTDNIILPTLPPKPISSFTFPGTINP